MEDIKKIAFTICAKNYIGLAQTLEASIKAIQDDVLFLIFVADEFGEGLAIQLPDNVIIAGEKLAIPKSQWYEMAFKYDLTEFCTSIKPSCFKYILQNYDVDACIYFDPDILVFNTLDAIYEKLNDYDILVTPHITTIETIYTGSLNERNLLYSGMFNLGFLALRNGDTAIKLLNWWEERLKDRCFQNMMENYFTDQKWMDFLPSLFPTNLLISTDLGLNLAPWNFYEREVFQVENKLYVKNRILAKDELYPLTFVHFSGFNYKALIKDEVIQGNIKGLGMPSDLDIIFSHYTKALKTSNISKFISLSYSYNFFSNNQSISLVYRRLFRRLLDDGKVNYNPFEESATLYKALANHKLLTSEMAVNDKTNASNIGDIESKTIKINKFFTLLFKLIGAQRFFLLTRLMRLYSKPENHVYLIDKEYIKHFKIWN
ncbi:hypothetical protein [Pedobacter jeongneungensis]|uniref:hypothetical protein n=1 Tax=Pedobacter jeongneungensis TaxID=947309 RepID=UPI00068EB4B6|nr:hypothetical protein [Pedobacter jeongneungensis]